MDELLNKIRELQDLYDDPNVDSERIKLQGGTDLKTGQGFQPGNPGNIKSLEKRNIKQTQFINLVPYGPARKFLKMFKDGGLSGGDKSGPPPESGPTPHGLPSLMKRGMKI